MKKSIITKKLVNELTEKKTKNQILKYISDTFVKQGFASSSVELLEAFKKRESQISTGMQYGYAIPHAASDTVKEPQVMVLKLSHAIKWPSLDKSLTDFVIAIIVPKSSRGDHFKILTDLAGKLVDESFALKFKKMTPEKIATTINSLGKPKSSSSSKSGSTTKKTTPKEPKSKELKEFEKDHYVIGITACPTGIAHTFMAAKSIENEAEKRGYKFKVETQGSEGIKNKLTLEDIEDASAIVISSGIRLEEMERFEGFEDKIFNSELQKTIANPETVLDAALKQANIFAANTLAVGDEKIKVRAKQSQTISTQAKKSGWKISIGHIMTGISAMLPVLVISGFLLAIANFGGLAWTYPDQTFIGNADWVFGRGEWAGNPQNTWVVLMYYMSVIGGFILQFMYPIFAMYLAYSIGGKLALVPGFVGGVLAQGIQGRYVDPEIYDSGLLSWAYIDGFIPSSFFGALAIGFLAGYLTNYLNKKISFKAEYTTLKTMLIMPLIMSVFVFFVMEFALNPAFGALNWGLQEAFTAAGSSGAYAYGSAIAAGTAFDLGGPINKAAGAVANGFNADYISQPLGSTFNLTARTLGIIIPPIGIGLAVLLGNKLTRRNIFTAQDVQVSKQTTFLGLIGISEGAIPFLLRYAPIVITANVVGSIVGSNIAIAFGSYQQLPLPAIWGWSLVGSTGIPGAPGLGIQISGYIIGLAAGIITVMIMFLVPLAWLDVKKVRKEKAAEKIEMLKKPQQKRAANSK